MTQERPLVQSILSKGKEIAARLAREEEGKLILVRKTGQNINIGGNILVEVLGVERDRVKIGITAPEDVKVMRGELFDLEGNLIPKAPDKIKERNRPQKPRQ